MRVCAHHLPGHTAGHCALVVESEGVAFIGDIDLSGFGPYYGDATSSLADFRASPRQGGTSRRWVERRSVALHLDALVGEGRVREEAVKCGLT